MCFALATPINDTSQDKKRIRKLENGLFTYFEDLNKPNKKKEDTDEIIKKIDEFVKQGANINYQDENGKGNNILHEVTF